MSDGSVAGVKPENPLLALPLEEVPDAWREHARELRRENARFRELAKQSDDVVQQQRIDAAVAAARVEQEARTALLLREERVAADRRVIAAELRSVAGSLGICDLDALRLLDASSVAVDAQTGEVTGAAEAVDDEGGACGRGQGSGLALEVFLSDAA